MSVRRANKRLLNDKDFFLSEEVGKHFSSLAKRLTGKEIRVIIDWNGGTGATDGQTIWASANNPFSVGMNREDMFSVLTAIILHEIGHILYSDFSLLQKMIEEMQKNGKFFPTPTVNYDESLIDVIGRDVCVHLMKGIWNSVEDGNDECRVMADIPAYKPEMATMRWSQYGMTSSLEDEQDKGLDKYSLIANRILTYAEFCDVKAEADNELLIKYVNPLLPIVRKGVVCKNAFLRASYCNDIFVRLLEVIVEEIKNQQKDQQQQQGGSSKENQQSSQEQQQGSSQEQQESGSQEQPQESGGSQEQAGEEKSSEGSGSEQSSEQGSEQSSQSGSQSSEQESQGGLSEDQKEALRQICQQMSQNMKETSENSASMTNKPVADECGEVEESLPQQPSETNPSDFKRLERKTEEQAMKNDTENKIQSELKSFPSSINFDDMHSKIKCRVYRKELSVSEYSYNKLEKEITPMVRHLVSELKKEIKQRQMGEKLSGLYIGRRLEGRNLYRQDKRIMSKNRLPEDIPDMRVCYLGDCSGSMSSYGKIEKSRKMALAVYTACKNLDIPVAVYGHTDTKGGDVNMFAYAEFDSVDDKDKFRIANMDTYSCNRDGYALKFCAERLARYPETVKLLFVTSDGLPNGSYGYGEKAGMVDIQKVLADCKKKNVVVVTAGLGEDKPNIERIWQPNGKKSCKFLDLSDEAMLPKKLVRIITSYLS